MKTPQIHANLSRHMLPKLKFIIVALATFLQAPYAMAQFAYTAIPGADVVDATTCVSKCTAAVFASNACFIVSSATTPVHFTVIAKNVGSTAQQLQFDYSAAVIAGVGHPVSTVHVDAPPGTFCPTDSVDGPIETCYGLKLQPGESAPFDVTVTPPSAGFTGTNALIEFFDDRNRTGAICVSVEPQVPQVPQCPTDDMPSALVLTYIGKQSNCSRDNNLPCYVREEVDFTAQLVGYANPSSCDTVFWLLDGTSIPMSAKPIVSIGKLYDDEGVFPLSAEFIRYGSSNRPQDTVTVTVVKPPVSGPRRRSARH